MKRRRRMGGLGGYAGNVAMTGTGVGLLESGMGTGTHMGADILTGGSKPIPTLANLQGTGMVLKGLGKLRVPKLRRRR